MTAATLLRAGVVGLALTAAAAAQTASRDKTTERPFNDGGTVYLDLRSGDYEILPSADNKIRVTVRDSRNHSADETNVEISVKGTRADVSVESPETEGVDVQIELPKRTHLVTRLTAGEIHLRGIEGSKDISARAGEINIEVGDPNRYRRVKASVTAGEIKASKFNAEKGGLFRSFSWEGKGKDDLSVSLWAGEITMN